MYGCGLSSSASSGWTSPSRISMFLRPCSGASRPYDRPATRSHSSRAPTTSDVLARTAFFALMSPYRLAPRRPSVALLGDFSQRGPAPRERADARKIDGPGNVWYTPRMARLLFLQNLNYEFLGPMYIAAAGRARGHEFK